MIYDLTKAIDKQKFKKRCNELFVKGAVIELTEKTNRSLSQNAYLHLLLTWFSIERGYTLEYTKRKYFKLLCNPEIFIIEVVDIATGEIDIDLKSSSKLTTAEMTTAIERFRNWSAQEADVYLPEPNETEFLREIQIEETKHKAHL
jgi:hypothetical protein